MGLFKKTQPPLKKKISTADIKRVSKKSSAETTRTLYEERPWEDPYLSRRLDSAMPGNATPALTQSPSSLSFITATQSLPTSKGSDRATDRVASKTPTSTDRVASKTPNSFKTADSEDPDAITPAPPLPGQPMHNANVNVDPIKGHSNVTIPKPPPRKHRFSELIDLDTYSPDSQVRSPSGNLLSIAEAKAREDRPKSIKERQEAIRRKIAEKEQEIAAHPHPFGNETTVTGNAKKKDIKQEKKVKRDKRMRKVKKAFLCY